MEGKIILLYVFEFRWNDPKTNEFDIGLPKTQSFILNTQYIHLWCIPLRKSLARLTFQVHTIFGIFNLHYQWFVISFLCDLCNVHIAHSLFHSKSEIVNFLFRYVYGIGLYMNGMDFRFSLLDRNRLLILSPHFNRH